MSLQRLNSWIAKTYPHVNIKLWKGDGYFFWTDADDVLACLKGSDVYNRIGFEFESIYVCHFSHASMDWWKAQAMAQINEYLNEKAAHAAGTTTAEAAGKFPIKLRGFDE